MQYLFLSFAGEHYIVGSIIAERIHLWGNNEMTANLLSLVVHNATMVSLHDSSKLK